MNRRTFLRIGAAGSLSVAAAARSSAASDRVEDEVPYGQSRLGLSDDGRDGALYVPRAYKPGTPIPCLMMLHGFAGWADNLRSTFALGEEFGIVIIAPESRGLTWGRSVPGFDDDVRYLGAAYRHVTSVIDVDDTHVALAGQSDGAGYALSMGLAYGDVFNHLMIFAGGMMAPLRKRGMPRIFFAHGRNDNQMPIDRTARLFVPSLKADGYDVTLREYDGGHGVPHEVVREAYQWFVGGDKRP
jgi:poly(3-hydroxybutyrate) depolymerase